VTVTPPQPLLRQEGFTELTADIVLTCVGAPGSSPTQAPNVIPQANITVSMTAPVTSRILPGGTLSTPLTDALLVVDDPSPGATYPALGNQNPCYSPLNPAVACQVVGDGGLTFNQPGKFNTFQGIGGGPGSNSVTFLGVPVDPPGPGLAVRTYRITNIRIDATNVGANNFTPVLAFVTSSSSTSMQIENPVNEVGFVSYGLTTSTSAVGLAFPECGPTAFTQVGSVTFTENFATAFKVAGSTGQNVPGTVYNTESGLEIAVTGTAGPADTGTRLQVVLTGIPIGVTVWVDDWAQSTAATGSIPSDATLVAGTVYVPPIDPVSNQPQQALPGTSATFVWEVTNTNPGAIDSLTFNIYVSINTFAIMGNALSLSGFSPQQASATSPMTGPIPEFSSTVNQPPSPTNIITVGTVYLRRSRLFRDRPQWSDSGTEWFADRLRHDQRFGTLQLHRSGGRQLHGDAVAGRVHLQTARGKFQRHDKQPKGQFHGASGPDHRLRQAPEQDTGRPSVHGQRHGFFGPCGELRFG
jgi:hypothetical protein